MPPSAVAWETLLVGKWLFPKCQRPFSLEKTSGRGAEGTVKWLFSKCQRPIPLGKPIRAWGCVCGEMTFFQNASDNFRLGTSLAREAEWIVKWLFPNCQLSFFSFSELTRTRWWQVKQYPSAYATSNFERKPSNSRVEKWLFKKCHAPQLLGKFS